MNCALTESFISLFASEHSQAYYNLLMQDPGRRFGKTFTCFYDLVGTQDEREVELNRHNMTAPWDPQWEFQALKVLFLNSVAIAAFVTAPIEAMGILSMLIAVTLAADVFQLEYTD